MLKRMPGADQAEMAAEGEDAQPVEEPVRARARIPG
jgi:hypothetical protein